MGRIRVIVALGALALAVAELGSAPTVAAASPGSARVVAGLKGWPGSALAAALSVSGPVTLGYSATTSETDSCTGFCLGTEMATGDYSSYNETATGSLQSKVNFIVNSDGTTTPGSAPLNEPSDTWNASGTFTGTVNVCFPLGQEFSGSATEVAQGGTLHGKLRVDSLKVSKDAAGQTDLTLKADDPEFPVENTSAAFNGTLQDGTPCNTTVPGRQDSALTDVTSVSDHFGLIGQDDKFLITGWTINPDWTPKKGGTLATKTLTGSVPQQSFGGETNTGTMMAAQTWTLATGPCVSPNKLSGPSWVDQFPDSQNIADLSGAFRQDVTNFINAMGNAGITVHVNSTRRPLQRAYLMHYSWLIWKGKIDPKDVPKFQPEAGQAPVNICWVHTNSSGGEDLPASVAAATQMVNGYKIAGLKVAPAFPHSLHIDGLAIDMNTTWNQPSVTIVDGAGNNVIINTTPHSGLNKQLMAVGLTYGVHHFCYPAGTCATKVPSDDSIHWSVNGH